MPAYATLLDLVGLSIAGGDPEATPILTASVVEQLNTVTRIKAIYGIPEDETVALKDVVGKRAEIKVKLEEGSDRKFTGVIIRAEYLGVLKGQHAIAIEIRPWLWLLGRTSDNRIFQEKTTQDIVSDVLNELGFSDFAFTVTGTLPTRVYTVQYHESTFDFISRLLEEDGLAYYFDYAGTVEKLTITNSVSGHASTATFKYAPRSSGEGSRDPDTIFEWSDSEQVVSGKVALIDYDFTKPGTRLDANKAIARGSHSHTALELYRMDGRFTELAAGSTLSETQLNAAQVDHSLVHAASNIASLTCGLRFSVQELPTDRGAGDFLLIGCTHYFSSGEEDEELKDLTAKVDMEVPKGTDFYMNTFQAMPLAAQGGGQVPTYRPPQTTPWPDLSGLHTAVVTGPSGEEIYTDEYGRIKVQFHWDRDGQLDENTTCWVRVIQPWAGQAWGMQSIPRIGQEVVIQFERNNPDRPICLGMIYNAFNMPPYELPANMTQTGIKTNSSKGGGGFNELLFEDLKDSEFVRLQSEKDYKEIIKNNAEITIGLEKKDPGDMTLTIHNHLTEKLNEGDHSFTVDKGKQTVIVEGNQENTVRTGNQTNTISQGNQTTTISQGNQKIDITAGKGETSAAQSFEIKVGGSSIKLEPMKITIKSPNVEIKGDMTFKAEGGMTAEVKGGISGTFEGGAMAILKGGMVKIN